jgi:hypothetical protein
VSFEDQLATGRIAEGLIAAWLKRRGSAVLPAYEIEKSSGKGPQLFSAEGNFVAPDMLTFTHNGVVWIEAKHKSVFIWHRVSKEWTTGIDLRHYGEYFNVLWRTKAPVWLLFYHREHTPDERDRRFGCPQRCPVGLYGGSLLDLVVREHHRAPHLDDARTGMRGHGRSGMVYWDVEALRLMATKDEVLASQSSDRGAA